MGSDYTLFILKSYKLLIPHTISITNTNVTEQINILYLSIPRIYEVEDNKLTTTGLKFSFFTITLSFI